MTRRMNMLDPQFQSFVNQIVAKVGAVNYLATIGEKDGAQCRFQCANRAARRETADTLFKRASAGLRVGRTRNCKKTWLARRKRMRLPMRKLPYAIPNRLAATATDRPPSGKVLPLHNTKQINTICCNISTELIIFSIAAYLAIAEPHFTAVERLAIPRKSSGARPLACAADQIFVVELGWMASRPRDSIACVGRRRALKDCGHARIAAASRQSGRRLAPLLENSDLSSRN